MRERLVDRVPVVDGDAREAEVVVRGVDEDDRQAALGEAAVVAVIGGRLVVLAAEEDDPGDVLFDQHVDVRGLGDAGGGAGTEDRRDAPPGERVRDDLRERREDRVL